MKKRILAIMATAIMVVSSTVMAFADTTTDLIGQFNFDGSLKNEVTGATATLTAEKVNVEVTGNEEESYSNGVTKQALILQGLTSKIGVKLDVAPSSSNFTLSYDIYYLNYSKHTPAFFLVNGWEDAVAEWASFGVGWKDSLAYAAGIWVHDVLSKTPTEWGDIWSEGGNADVLLTDNAWTAWKNITYVITDGVVQIYVNGEAIPQGNTQPYLDFANENTQLYIGVNAWDAPLDAAVDNVYIYDRALTADDVKELLNGRDYAASAKPEVTVPETTSNRPTMANKDNAPYLDQGTEAPAEEEGGLDPVVIIIAAAVAVVVVIVVVVAIVASKKKGGESKNDEE